METMYYRVVLIDGDYAHLLRLDKPDPETKLVARALLPWDADEGSILKYEMLSYETAEDWPAE